ncbi:hypothetical protein H4R21_000031 [Coemansia helicoidea]|uniref:Uncharacterized protein n=1 Tax=Coemansia helicoidea TaxID=1286919 RepID=A0ACC1LHV7_9FUNG|nr:hypothetical protein H4R21_000031 [Coemansia helicoidea]
MVEASGGGCGPAIAVDPPTEPPQQQQQQQPAAASVWSVVGGLVAFSMAGVLVRVHLTRLFTYDGAPIYALVWAQMAGCFVMGVATRTKDIVSRWSPALHTGITTGLCGSVTTFSSWQLLVFQQFFNTGGSRHSHFRNFLGGASVLVSTMECAVGALRLGQMVGDELCAVHSAYAHRAAAPRVEAAGGRKWRPADVVLAASGVAAIVAASVVAGVAGGTRSVSIALLFGWVGTLARWRLALLNARSGSWLRGKGPSQLTVGLPLGTFIANVAGSAVLAVVYVLLTGAVVRPSAASCNVLAALADGFCGCLTTVSTFAVELTEMPARKSALYMALSVVAAQAFFLPIAGIYFKTAAVDYPTC